MFEFTFKKDELATLLANDPGPNDTKVVIRLSFVPEGDKVFAATVVAFCEDASGQPVTPAKVKGCPRPPGCDE